MKTYVQIHFWLFVVVPFALLCSINSVAQVEQRQRIDSLKFEVKKADSLVRKLEAYNDLIFLLRYRKDSSDALTQNKNYLRLSVKIGDEGHEVKALKFYADIYEHHGLISKSINFQQHSLQKALEIRDTSFICLIYGDLAYTYTNLSDYKTALEYQQKAMIYAEKSNDRVRQSWLYFSLSELLYNINDTEEAYKALIKGYQIALSINNIVILKTANQRMGDYYQKLTKNYKQALIYYNKAISCSNKTNDKISIADISFEKSKCFYHITEYDSSIFHVNRAIELWAKNGQKWSLPGGYLLLSITHLKTDNIMDATASLDLVDSLKEFNLSNAFKIDYYKTRYQINLAENDTTSAFKNLLLYKDFEDTLTSESLAKSLLEMKVKFETDRKKQEIEKQELIIDQQSKTNQQKNIFLSGIVFTLIIVLILLIWVYYSRKKVQKVNKLLSSQKQEIEKQNNEKAVLLKEIHHRVKNNLQVISSLLNLQSRNIEDEAALSAVKEGQNRVKSIALIHQKLYQTDDLSEVKLDEYIEQLMGFLKTAFGKNDVEVVIKLSPENLALDIDTAVPFGLILNELVTNAFKYAFDNSEQAVLKIEVAAKQGGEYLLTVSDNGKGLPQDFDWKKSRTLGMRLIRELSKQLRGKIAYECDSGAKFSLTFHSTDLRKEVE